MTDTLATLIRRHSDTPPGRPWFATAIDGLILLRADHERRPSHLVFKPSLCVVAQGSKWTTFGQRRFVYPPGRALVVSVEMPALSKVSCAGPDEPFLGLSLGLDPPLMGDVLEALPTPPGPVRRPDHGVFVTDFDGPLSDGVLRLVRLLDTPEAIPFVAPLIKREIAYWLLAGPHGAEVAGIALANGHARRIVQAVHTLRAQFRQPVKVEELAAIAQLSPSAFHRRFKALTSMTPVQYQKQLRLLEARHLLMGGAANVEAAALQVGYESPSQFNREYARMFGAPPRRDIATLRANQGA